MRSAFLASALLRLTDDQLAVGGAQHRRGPWELGPLRRPPRVFSPDVEVTGPPRLVSARISIGAEVTGGTDIKAPQSEQTPSTLGTLNGRHRDTMLAGIVKANIWTLRSQPVGLALSSGPVGG